ncbi:MAG: diguanylate cyclase [Sphaerochaetaceae bacterium]|nr:diguanylate cyclase [Sphaerochaetaceae bacterium]
MKNRPKNLSIKHTIISLFIIAMVIAACAIGYIIFSRWYTSAEDTARRISATVSEQIHDKIKSFMDLPNILNDAGHNFLNNRIIDIDDEQQRDKFFVSSLASSSEDIYSFSYGTEQGEYYGARRNEHGSIEIMRNNSATGGTSWYYSVNDDLTTGDVVVQAGTFDPRTRAWYLAAKESGKQALSPVYKHFVMDDLTISASRPVFDANGELEGVIGTHMLLSNIGHFLEQTLNDYQGNAIIVEKETGLLIANSMDLANFSRTKEGTLYRVSVHDIDNPTLIEAYEVYRTEQNLHHTGIDKTKRMYANISEYQSTGAEWLVISVIPGDFVLDPVLESIFMTIILIAIAILIITFLYNLLANRLFRPVRDLLNISSAFSSGDLSNRAKVIRKDEIGNISSSFNQVADEMQFLINNLEENVEQRTTALHNANIELEKNKGQLQLILDSTAEAIYGIDRNGNCTFCNLSSIGLLGYAQQEDLLGKNMHEMIHHSYSDGTLMPSDECKIFQSIRDGKGYASEDEVFWRANGTSFDVAYHAYPQIRDNQIIGGVVTFMDITERKQREREINYLMCHDTLTGLHNRSCFEQHYRELDIQENLPLSIIFADINGLKMVNDIFGHASGDRLIKTSADILEHASRERDLIARIGGDEFVVLMPKTDKAMARDIVDQIQMEVSEARIEAMKCSISIGIGTKEHPDQSIEEIMTDAENEMYRDKAINRTSVNDEIIDTLQETLHARSAREKQHSEFVSEYCGKLGMALQLRETEVATLKRAGYLHDIGKITLDEKLLEKSSLTDEEYERMHMHSVAGFRILNLFDHTLDLAEYIYSHHERWDGTGYPRKLRGNQIPKIARILSIVETYERVLNRGTRSYDERKHEALTVIKEGAGTQFDPHFAKVFIELIEQEAQA